MLATRRGELEVGNNHAVLGEASQALQEAAGAPPACRPKAIESDEAGGMGDNLQAGLGDIISIPPGVGEGPLQL